MKIHHILVPTDFSAHSKSALDYAIGLAEKFPSKISLLHVLEPFFTGGSEVSLMYASVEKERREAARAQLAEKAAATGNRCEIEAILEDGVPWRAICDHANTHEIDLIVLPTHGYTGIKHLWMGSTAERVVQHAHCPVLVTRAHDAVSS